MDDKKVAVVTGSAGGIGKKIAEVLAESGSKLVLIDVNKAQLEETVKEFEQKGFEVKGFIGSVSDENEIQKIAKEVSDVFGKVDHLVNNAGIKRDGLLMRMKRYD